jgi:hypothetical protein
LVKKSLVLVSSYLIVWLVAWRILSIYRLNVSSFTNLVPSSSSSSRHSRVYCLFAILFLLVYLLDFMLHGSLIKLSEE